MRAVQGDYPPPGARQGDGGRRSGASGSDDDRVGCFYGAHDRRPMPPVNRVGGTAYSIMLVLGHCVSDTVSDIELAAT
ncbi:hypothetical protein GCM10027088_68970 [Nocardia goodfellowii]